MRQQVNLLNPALITPREYFTPNNLLLALGVLVLLILGDYGYAHKQLATLALQRSQAAAELKLVQEQFNQAALQHTSHGTNKALEDQIAQLEQKAKVHERVLQVIGHDSGRPDKAFSDLMRAFARQSMEGLWLTGFNIDNSADALTISGRALQPELVPHYIARLGTEAAFKGKSFATLNMYVPKVKETASAVVVAQPAAGVPEQTHSADLGDIEFVLQSTDKKTVNAVEPAAEGNKS